MEEFVATTIKKHSHKDGFLSRKLIILVVSVIMLIIVFVKRTHTTPDTLLFRNNITRTGVLDTALQIPDTFSNVKWKIKAEHVGSSSPLYYNGVVYWGHYGVSAINAKNGNELWTFHPEGPQKTFHSSPAIWQNYLFIGRHDGYLYALNKKSGKLAWKVSMGKVVVSSPVVINSRLYVGGYDGFLYALNPKTGKKIWSTKVDTLLWSSSPTVSLEDSTLYIGGSEHIHAVDMNSGAILWQHKIPHAVDATIALYGKHLVFADRYGTVSVLDRHTKELLWERHNSIGFASKAASPTVHRNMVFYGNRNNYMAYDLLNGDTLWTFADSSNDLISSSTIVGDKILFGNQEGVLHVLDFNTGEEFWNFKTDHWLHSAPTASKGVVYISSRDGFLYAIE